MAGNQFTGGVLYLMCVLLILGCESSPQSVKHTRWDCGDGLILIVQWEKDWVQVSWEGRTWRLPRAISASGARYSDGEREAWEHQGKLRWTDAGEGPKTCLKILDR